MKKRTDIDFEALKAKLVTERKALLHDTNVTAEERAPLCTDCARTT